MAGPAVIVHVQEGGSVSRHVQDPETGAFMGRVSVACERAEQELRTLIAAKAEQHLAAAFPNSYGVEASPTASGVELTGQWAQASEFGTPDHPISPNAPGYALHGGGPNQHYPDDFGPVLPDDGFVLEDEFGPGVWHPGTDASFSLKRAGDHSFFLGQALLVEYCP